MQVRVLGLSRILAYELQEKERIHACMLLGGLDDQDRNDWDDEECKNVQNAGDLNIPVAILCSGDSEYEVDLPSLTTTTSSTGTVLTRVPSATLCYSDGSEEEDDGDGETIQRSWITQIRVLAGSVRRSAEHL